MEERVRERGGKVEGEVQMEEEGLRRRVESDRERKRV